MDTQIDNNHSQILDSVHPVELPAHPKLALLRLAERLGSVSQACRALGYGRASYYRIRARYLAGGEDALFAGRRRAAIAPNRTPAAIEAVVVELAREHPSWGRRRTVTELAARGIVLSPSGVRGVWARHGLLTASSRRDPGIEEGSVTAAAMIDQVPA